MAEVAQNIFFHYIDNKQTVLVIFFFKELNIEEASRAPVDFFCFVYYISSRTNLVLISFPPKLTVFFQIYGRLL